MESDKKLILALETAIGGGSIALVTGQEVLFERSLGTARADVLLSSVESILTQTKTKIQDISKLAVSKGPGSFTGIRVGISTALGLRRSIPELELVGISAFAALASISHSGTVAAVLPLGRGWFGFQLFDGSSNEQIAQDAPIAIPEGELVRELIKRRPKSTLFVESQSTKILNDIDREKLDVDVVHESKLAGLLGRLGATRQVMRNIDPIYLR